MGAPSPRAFNALYMLLSTLSIAMVVAVVIIVDQKFWTYIAGYVGYSTYVYNTTCYLGTYNESTNLCYFNWAMASIGGFVLLMVFFMAMCNNRPGRATPFLIMLIVASGIFLADGIVNTINIPTTNDSLKNWRTSIEALVWSIFGLTALSAVASLFDVIGNKNRPPPPPPPPQFMTQMNDPNYGAPYPPGGYPPPQPMPYGTPYPPPPQPQQPGYGGDPYKPQMYNQPPPAYGSVPGGYPPQV